MAPAAAEVPSASSSEPPSMSTSDLTDTSALSAASERPEDHSAGSAPRRNEATLTNAPPRTARWSSSETARPTLTVAPTTFAAAASTSQTTVARMVKSNVLRTSRRRIRAVATTAPSRRSSTHTLLRASVVTAASVISPSTEAPIPSKPTAAQKRTSPFSPGRRRSAAGGETQPSGPQANFWPASKSTTRAETLGASAGAAARGVASRMVESRCRRFESSAARCDRKPPPTLRGPPSVLRRRGARRCFAGALFQPTFQPTAAFPRWRLVPKRRTAVRRCARGSRRRGRPSRRRGSSRGGARRRRRLCIRLDGKYRDRSPTA
mmetsp:Transcript_25238/g.87156  ORF Transcript_25238/g.87156 Transcript_25238/m.87156 type:complete len:321 (-) Transcript_25238:711-1673(-)